MKEHNYKELKEEDVIRFLKESVRPFFNASIFNWEFTTFKDTLVFKLYSFNNKLVASQAMLPVRLIINGAEVSTAKSETSYLSKDHRGQNHFENLYFSTLEESKQKGFQLIWGFTAAVKVWKSKLNFDVVDSNISEATMPLSKYPSNEFLKKYTPNKIVLAAKLMLYSIFRSFEKKHKYVVDEKAMKVAFEFPEASVMKEFQRKLADKFGISVYLDMNQDYINWRVKTNPLLNYHGCFFYNQSGLTGYAIYSINDGRLSIADLSYLDIETGKYIINYILNKNTDHISSVFYFGNDDSEYGKSVFGLLSLYKATIIKSAWANTVIKDISEGNKYVRQLDTSKWFINGLWTEGFSI